VDELIYFIICCTFSLHADGQLFIRQRIRHLVRAFTERAQRIRRRLELPPTPSTVSSDPGQNQSEGRKQGHYLQPSPKNLIYFNPSHILKRVYLMQFVYWLVSFQKFHR
jgi:hypothetical protein